MAKYLCIKACYMHRRFWDPTSRLEKDKVINWDEELEGGLPPANLFKPMAADEEAPNIGSEQAEVTTLSEMQAKSGGVPACGPVVEGREIAPPAPASPPVIPEL